MTRSCRAANEPIVRGHGPDERAIRAGCPTIAASSPTRRSETRPVIGSLCSRSNFSIAALVAIVENARRLDLTIAECRTGPAAPPRCAATGRSVRRSDRCAERQPAAVPAAAAIECSGGVACAGHRPACSPPLRPRRIGEERRRMRTRLQKDGVDDDDDARRACRQDGEGIDRTARGLGPQPTTNRSGARGTRTHDPRSASAAVTHFSSPICRNAAAPRASSRRSPDAAATCSPDCSQTGSRSGRPWRRLHFCRPRSARNRAAAAP